MNSKKSLPERLTASGEPAQIAAALDLVLGGLPDDARRAFRESLIHAATFDPESLGELWHVRAHATGETIGAAWAQVRPGGTAVVWPSQWLATSPIVVPDPLLAAILPALSTRGVTMAQSLVLDRDGPDAATLVGSGFRHLADLCYLAAPATPAESAVPSADSASPTDPVRPLELAAVDTTTQERLIEVIDETYRDTLDCAELDGTRRTIDVLDEYRTIGTSADKLWFLVRHDHRDVGCLLLADHPAQQQMELVYMGLVPSARGRGWGGVVVREALQIARSSERAQVVVAVDAANWPALSMYRRAGFAGFDRRSAYFLCLPRSSEISS